jgi:hypothetical protein
MAANKSFTLATEIKVYFCDPAALGGAARTRTLWVWRWPGKGVSAAKR